ncbi:hypothetical protein L211DRAFT_864828 [Terfezia boudieri ATCC MYA-4762]|uniref:Uncharacterized protein n=1 Tax=Terfezia boudieri ATCC MYA-4762 TaxID=1051890 RepID=A0A3N4M5W6_9PEZI|nr:hypothetical protein L211DRAFT_864828 [Terfezia boudieri ATCC MYA-4762]
MCPPSLCLGATIISEGQLIPEPLSAGALPDILVLRLIQIISILENSSNMTIESLSIFYTFVRTRRPVMEYTGGWLTSSVSHCVPVTDFALCDGVQEGYGIRVHFGRSPLTSFPKSVGVTVFTPFGLEEHEITRLAPDVMVLHMWEMYWSEAA